MESTFDQLPIEEQEARQALDSAVRRLLEVASDETKKQMQDGSLLTFPVVLGGAGTNRPEENLEYAMLYVQVNPPKKSAVAGGK